MLGCAKTHGRERGPHKVRQGPTVDHMRLVLVPLEEHERSSQQVSHKIRQSSNGEHAHRWVC